MASGWPFLFVAALYSLNPVTVSVYPAFGLPPATFRMTVMAPRHEGNRNLCLGYRFLGELENVRDSCQQMDGVNSTRVRTVYWAIRTTGEYEAVAVLTRIETGRERTYRDVQPFTVIGMQP